MSNLLSRLLNADEPLFSLAIKQLENAAGRPSADVRLMSEIIQVSRQKIVQLGLDPHDTTGEELYYALLHKVRIHDEHLAKHIGVKNLADTEDMRRSIKNVLERSKLQRNVWVLKKSVAKRLLHQMPPEKIMKHLGYSSVESMTKRENMSEIYSALRFVESPVWLKRFNKAYKSLQPSDFENRDVEVVVLGRERWGELAKGYIAHKQYCMTHLKEMGVLALLPPDDERIIGFTIATLPMALHYINEMRLYSAFFKLHQVRPDFGKIIANTLNDDRTVAAEMAGNKIHWRVICRHFGRAEHTESDEHPEIFQPHIQPEDLYWRKAEEQLYAIDPELKFWNGLDYVGVDLSEGPISFNLLDASMNYYLAVSYQDRKVTHMRASLWNELYARYLGVSTLKRQVLSQLDATYLTL